MKNVIVWIVAIIIIAGGVYWYMNDKSVSQIVVPLNAQNDSGMSGTATLADVNGGTLVKLSLTGAPANVAQPAHIHTGSCATIGGVVYPLTSTVNGISDTMLSVPLSDILAQLPLALNVHKSATEASVYVACGDLAK